MLTLRQDLDLMEADRARDGSRRWLLRDPANNRFFKLGSDEIKILAYLKDARPRPEELEALAEAASRRFNRAFSHERMQKFLLFLRQNNLLVVQGPESRAYLQQQRDQLKPGAFKSLLRNYLFLKFHLVRPNRLLGAMLPWCGWFFRRPFWLLIALNTLFGLYLTSRQLDVFLASFIGYLNLSGLAAIGIALALVKILHELGHALAARRFGCSVYSMGIAFLLFWPVLFTDTTDAWRLKERRQRVLIGLSGVLVELAIASVSLTLWNFAPEGMTRNVLFVLASTTWIMTLAINLNPLMRFDGYFVFADLLGVDNLQDRSFALARWKMRELMFGFGFGFAPPERPAAGLIVFAVAVWIYRFLLYLGIALLIYNYFFKLLGLVLMSVQVFSFLVKPVLRELRFWWDHRKSSRLLPNGALSFGLLFAVLLWLVLPSSGTLSLPAYIRAADSQTVFASEPGRLRTMIDGEESTVKAGQVLVELEMPDIRFRLGQVEKDIALLEDQLAGLGVSTAEATPRGALLAQLRSAREQRADLSAKLEASAITAAFDGVVRDLADDLDPGQWVGAGTRLMTLLRPAQTEAVAFVSEQDVSRIAPGQAARFYPEGGTRAVLDLEVASVEAFPVGELDELYVASSEGGGLAVRDSSDGEGLRPREASYRVYLRGERAVPERVLRGTAVIGTAPLSPARRYWRELLGLWRRESGF